MTTNVGMWYKPSVSGYYFPTNIYIYHVLCLCHDLFHDPADIARYGRKEEPPSKKYMKKKEEEQKQIFMKINSNVFQCTHRKHVYFLCHFISGIN